ncbi:hypothetical protein LIER_02102 [Lithospermum erythrorhizon]|uniref:Uncharacterized protein n=1 Tax=Lithospermum erythrorhizon TaxID=34254 RepID=A0AAV3NPR0_LITER
MIQMNFIYGTINGSYCLSLNNLRLDACSEIFEQSVFRGKWDDTMENVTKKTSIADGPLKCEKSGEHGFTIIIYGLKAWLVVSLFLDCTTTFSGDVGKYSGLLGHTF